MACENSLHSFNVLCQCPLLLLLFTCPMILSPLFSNPFLSFSTIWRGNTVWTWKPVLIEPTERLLPQLSQFTNHNLFSLERVLSELLQVLHVTYSAIYRLMTVSSCFCWNLPLRTILSEPSMLPFVPSSAKRNSFIWSKGRLSRTDWSWRFAKMVLLEPSRKRRGGGRLTFLPAPREGLFSLSILNTRTKS